MEEIEKYAVATIANGIKKNQERVVWFRIDEETAMTDLVKELIVKAMIIDEKAPFDHAIKVTAERFQRPRGPYAIDRRHVVPHDVRSGSFVFNGFLFADDRRKIRVQIATADALGIFDDDDEGDGTTLGRFLKSIEDLDYYQYLEDGVELVMGLSDHLAEKIHTKLTGKRYLLQFSEATEPKVEQSDLLSMGLPLPDRWNKSWWLITQPGRYRTLKDGSGRELDPFDFDGGRLYTSGLAPLQASRILSSLFPTGVSTVDYMDAVQVVSDCYFYSTLFLPKNSRRYDYGIQEDELVKYWIEDGIITQPLVDDASRKITADEEDGQDSSLLFDTGKAILDQFLTGSMLARIYPSYEILTFDEVGKITRQLPPQAIITLHGFYGVRLRENWHRVEPEQSVDWMDKKLPCLPFDPHQCSKLTTLVLRACDGLANIPEDLFRDMPLLRVVDFSYTDLIFLPSSILCLENLRLLSLRGCRKIESFPTSPSSPSQSLLPSPVRVLPRLRVLDLSCPNLVSLSPTIDTPELRELFLQGCYSLSTDQTSFFEPLNKLRVVRLTESKIVAFRESTFCLTERLRVLDLSNNRRLASLPGSLANAKRLQEVRVCSCNALEDLKAIRSAKLRSFSFADNDRLTNLPDPLCDTGVPEEIRLKDCRALRGIDAIGGCARLRILSLTGITHLNSLPDSFSKLHNLEELYIAECEGLGSIDLVLYKASKLRVLSLVNILSLRSLPEWLCRARALEELRLENCRALKEIKMEGGCTNIRSLFLSGSPIVELSLPSCKNLDTVTLRDLPELEVLDLSFTRIRDLPAEIFSLHKLRRFDMVAARHLRRFPWHAIPRLPIEFNLDNSSSDDREVDQKSSSSIFVDDPRFFCSLTAEASQRLLGEVQQFHVRISPATKPATQVTDRLLRSTALLAAARRYSHVLNARENLTCGDTYRPTHRHLCRYLTMEGLDRFPYRPFRLLDSIDSLSVSNDRSLDALAGLSPMGSLRECRLKQCHNMEYAFEAEETRQQGLLSVLWVVSLGKLAVLCRRCRVGSAEAGEFRSLQHLHLEHCVRLESVFPAGFSLPSLETLTVKYCDSLSEIFFGGRAHNVLPKLTTVRLLELPKLLHFSPGAAEARMPALKELYVRGCWRLYRLPLVGSAAAADASAASSSSSSSHDQQRQQEEAVDVGGEQEWWNRLIWDHYRIDGSIMNRHIRFKARPSFAFILVIDLRPNTMK